MSETDDAFEGPDLGLHEDVPYAVYASWDAARFSHLKTFAKSAAHALQAMREPEQQKDHLDLGHAFHLAVLEPDKLRAEFIGGPEGDKRLKKTKDAWAALEADHPEKIILRGSDWRTLQQIRDSVSQHAKARSLLSGNGLNECSILWQDDETGVLCKARTDRMTREVGETVIIDLKSAVDASPSGFSRAADRFQYPAQAAHYLSGLNHIAPCERRFMWIVVEKSPPYAVAVYEPDLGALEYGKRRIRSWLLRLAESIRTGEWPGYPSGVNLMELPAWAYKQEEYDEDAS